MDQKQYTIKCFSVINGNGNKSYSGGLRGTRATRIVTSDQISGVGEIHKDHLFHVNLYDGTVISTRQRMLDKDVLDMLVNRQNVLMGAAPKYKVGEWVECINHKKEIFHGHICSSDLYDNRFVIEVYDGVKWKNFLVERDLSIVNEDLRVTRKLSSFEVVLDFNNGLKGRIEQVGNGTLWTFRIINEEGYYGELNVKMFSGPMRFLIEELLMAQEKERQQSMDKGVYNGESEIQEG